MLIFANKERAPRPNWPLLIQNYLIWKNLYCFGLNTLTFLSLFVLSWREKINKRGTQNHLIIRVPMLPFCSWGGIRNGNLQHHWHCPPLKLVTLIASVLLSVFYIFTTFLLNQLLLRKFCVPLSEECIKYGQAAKALIR